MYCKYCGTQLPEGANFCTACGKEQNEHKAEPQTQITPEERNGMRNSILAWGITSLAFSATTIFALIGLILSCIAKKKASEYKKTFGVLDWQAKVGNHLAKAGFGVGLGFTIFWAVYFLIIILIILSTI